MIPAGRGPQFSPAVTDVGHLGSWRFACGPVVHRLARRPVVAIELGVVRFLGAGAARRTQSAQPRLIQLEHGISMRLLKFVRPRQECSEFTVCTSQQLLPRTAAALVVR